ncbi:MAG: 9-O-acetylesterase [Candidatus Azobacteroides sp.]|nr:9-O-acetylesterase [Candidatus Azobacteroides sp.]
MKKKHIYLIFLLACLTCPLSGQLSLSSIFTDNMVLQQQMNAPIWGKATPNKTVKITTSWDNRTYEATADAQGKWKTELVTPGAGGPYQVTVSTDRKNSIQLKNVLIGEVWICSGQSNMEMQVDGLGQVYNYEQEKATANYPQIRFLTVDHNISPVPLDDAEIVGKGWLVCSPETVGTFSAVGYFFGRDLYQNLNVPIGLINTSFGGTVAEAWTSEESLEMLPYFSESLAGVKKMSLDKEAQQKVYQQQILAWNERLNGMDPDLADYTRLAPLSAEDSSWRDIQLPAMIEMYDGLEAFDGLFWCRKEIDIPASWAGKELILNLGSVDDIDFTYFNGQEIGTTAGWNVNRNYIIPGDMVKAGKAVITVRVIDTGGSGGFGGSAEDMYIGTHTSKISLAGDWKLKISFPLHEIPPVPQNPADNPNFPTVLYNAMIHPLVPYGMRGAIWYQGESNDYNPRLYYDIFPLMINDWRSKWNNNFPFYFVQLANFTRLQTEPVESSWALIRDAQLNALHLENTGMAVSIDIGDAEDIHPRNKQGVGLRLALNARANTYGENIRYSGPIYNDYKIEGNKIRISFIHTAEGLTTREHQPLQGFTVAGPDRVFHWAEATIDGDEIVVSSPEVRFPMAVRYAWAHNPIGNLYNERGLPASPFRTDSW